MIATATSELSLIQYGGFKVHLKDISEFFIHVYRNPNYTKSQLERASNLGANKVENYRYYLRDFGLLTPGKYSPTKLADLIYKYDPRFVEEFTQWVLLYNWSKMEGNPLLHFYLNWDDLDLEASKLEGLFVIWAQKNNFKHDYGNDTVGKLITRTRESLIDGDAFQTLNVLKETSPIWRRGEPYNVHPLLLAYILYDNKSAQQHSISIDQLLQENGNIGKFLGYDTRMLESKLAELVNLEIVKRVQVANLNMIEFTGKETALAYLERFYVECT